MEAYRFRGGAHNHHGGNYGSRQAGTGEVTEKLHLETQQEGRDS